MFSLNINGCLRVFSRPAIMGVLNVTPDSFWTGSRVGESDVVSRAMALVAEGADILDIGGCSTRPGSAAASEEEELRRVVPAIAAVRAALPEVIVSVDTFRAGVAREAVAAGAQIVNDVNGLDDDMLQAVKDLRVPYVLTHCADITSVPTQDAPARVVKELSAKVRRLALEGVADVIVDPGFGFGKRLDQNYALLRHLTLFGALGRPILVGVSRKSMIANVLHISADEALNGTTVLNTLGLLGGASVLRVHDVKAAAEASALVHKFLNR